MAQGMIQQLQSSPHQHCCLIGLGFTTEEAAEETVDAGIMLGAVQKTWIRGIYGGERAREGGRDCMDMARR